MWPTTLGKREEERKGSREDRERKVDIVAIGVVAVMVTHSALSLPHSPSLLLTSGTRWSGRRWCRNMAPR